MTNNRNHDLNKPENWVVGKRRGNKVRYRNKVTGAWDGWQRVIPHTVGDVIDFEFAQSEAAARKRHPTNQGQHAVTITHDDGERPVRAFANLKLVDTAIVPLEAQDVTQAGLQAQLDAEHGPGVYVVSEEQGQTRHLGADGKLSVVDTDEYHPDFADEDDIPFRDLSEDQKQARMDDEDADEADGIVEVALPSPDGSKPGGRAALLEAMQDGAELAREQFPDYDIAEQPASGGIQEFTPSRTDELNASTVAELLAYIRNIIPKEHRIPNLSKARKGTLVTLIVAWEEQNLHNG